MPRVPYFSRPLREVGILTLGSERTEGVGAFDVEG